MASTASKLVDTGIRGSDNPMTSVSKSFVENFRRIRLRVLIDLVSLLSTVVWKRFAPAMVHKLDLPAQAVMRWFRDQDRSVSTETISVGVRTKKPTTTTWDSPRNDLWANVSENVDFRDLFRFKTSANSWKFCEAFRRPCGGVSEGTFMAINNYIQNKSWRCSGYDLHSKSWRSFPSLSYLPPPDAELSKEYSVSGYGGLMCAEVSKLPNKGELVVFNPLTGETRALPPLHHPRNPVLVHILVDPAKKFYKVTVAGSSAASDEHLSRKVEVFDSSTSKWREVCDLPGPAFGLNEHQAGVCLNGKLFFISFLEGGGRGVVAFDVENGTWLPDLTVPIPWSSYSNTLQLVESHGKLFLFSEQELDQSVSHCIDELEFPNPKAGVLTCRWRNVVRAKKSGGRGLQVYPEHTCVGFGERKLCIFNTLSRIAGLLTCRWRSFVKVKKSGRRGFQVYLGHTCVDSREGKRSIFRKKFYFLLSSCFFAILPAGARAEDQTVDFLIGIWTSGAWESPDFAKKTAVTLSVVLSTMIGAKLAWEIFRRLQARGNRFDIMRGLEDGDVPRRGNPLLEILPEILA